MDDAGDDGVEENSLAASHSREEVTLPTRPSLTRSHSLKYPLMAHTSSISEVINYTLLPPPTGGRPNFLIRI